MPRINQKCHQNHFLGVLGIIGCRLLDDLKTTLTGPEIMAFPEKDGEYILDCDASDV